MKKKRSLFGILLLMAMPYVQAQNMPKPYGPTPTAAQLEWQKMEMNMFCHFGPNTFTGKEWGDGTEVEDIFNPTDLNCRQWTETAKAAGFKGVIITAKHHDGFCLWPNPVSEHTVKQSAWRNGQGDVLKELATACQQSGLKFGVYISPWDRNAPTYGTPAYNNIFLQTLQSALTNYGPVFEQWFDGANGEGPNGKKQVYDWPAFNGQVYKLQPNAVIFSDVGPGCHWMGNENGVNGRTSWSRLDVDGFGPGAQSPALDTLNTGNYNGKYWIPAETDVSIRPGWFYRDSEHPKSVNELLNIYYTSVGRNSLLLLNVPPDQRGHIAEEDSMRLMEFRAALDSIFAHDLAQEAEFLFSSNMKSNYIVVPWRKMAGDSRPAEVNLIDGNYDTYWVADDNGKRPEITLQFAQPQTFNRIVLQEYIPLGQRVAKFHINAKLTDGKWHTIADETTIGYKRIVLTNKITATQVRIIIDEARALPVINNVGIYLDNITELVP